MADINHLQIAISTKYHKLWYTTAELELGDSHVTKFKIADGHHFKNCFLVITQQPISRFQWKFARWSSFFIEFRQWNKYLRSQNVFFVFLMQFWLRWAAAFSCCLWYTSLLSSLLFSSLRGRQLLNCLALRPPIGPNALPLINQLVIEIS